MMSGSIQRSSSVVIGSNGPSPSNGLSISPTTALQSPLQIFVRAKKRINDVFGEVELYVTEAVKFLNGKDLALPQCHKQHVPNQLYGSLHSIAKRE